MNINYKEAQFEFFPNSSSSQTEQSRALSANLSLSMENLVILTIVAIMIVLFSFSLGVERGKKVAFVRQPEAVPTDSTAEAQKPEMKDRRKAFDFFRKKETAKETNAVSQEVLAMAVTAEAPAVPEPVAGLEKKAEAAKESKPFKSGNFTVQVASYKTEKWANVEASNLKRKGYQDVYVVPKGSYVIVCIGDFQKKEDANSLTRKLKNRYQDSVVRRL